MNSQNVNAGAEPRAGRAPPQASEPGRLARLAWLPIPLLAGAVIIGRAAGLDESYKSETLTLLLSFIFYTLVSLGTVFLIGRSFLALGTPGLLLLECGVILWSLAGTVGDAVSHGDENLNVSIFNTGILLAGLCHLAGAVLSLRPRRALRATRLWLGASCALALGALWLVTRAALASWLPVFFVPGQGGTPVRYCVLISTIAMFVLSAGLLLARPGAARAPFTSWYALALLLLAVGLFGVMIQLSLGSVVNWLGRTAQWLGGVYLLLAAVGALHESHLPLLPPEEKSRPERYRYGVAIAIVLAAAAVRLAFLPALGTRAPYVAFFPAVVFATIYGGWRAGLLATVLSAILAGNFWIEPAGQFAMGQPADWLGTVSFVLSGLMIVWIAEALRQARARAAAAETQVLLAAEREAAAEVLRKSEERYHTLFTGMTEGFAIHELLTDESGKSVDYRFLDVNPAFERLTGLKRQDVVGKTHNEVLPSDDPKWLQIYSEVALTGQPVQFENYAPVLKRHYEVFAYRPAPMQFAVIFMDVTERKQAGEKMRQARAAAINLMEDAVEARQQTERANENLRQEIAERKRAGEALRESEARLNHAQQIANVGSWEWDIATGALLWSDQTYRQMGEEPGRFTPSLAAFLQRIHPEDRAVFEAAVERAVARTSPFDLEFRIVQPGGAVRVLHARGEVVCSPDAQPQRMIGACLDITERKRMEDQLQAREAQAREQAAQLQAVLDSAPAIIWIAHDRECRSIAGNQAAHEFSRVPAGTDLSKTGPEPERLVHYRVFENGVEKAPHEMPIQRVAASGQPLTDCAVDFHFDDGTLRSALGNVVPVLDAQGHPNGAIAAFVDITELKKLERERDALLTSERAARTEAERANRAKDEFISTLSHELRNPLNAILGWAQLLRRPKRSAADVAEGIEIIESSGRALADMISDLLDLSRITSGKLRLDVQTVDLHAVIAAAVAAAKPAIEAKGIHLKTKLDAAAGPVRGDPNRLQQVVWNLLSNAGKFTDRGGRVEIALRRIDSQVEVSVSDNGQGIEPEFLPHIFERFRQEDASAAKKHGGLGLGLSIVRHLVELHGGTVGAVSPGKGQGATFTVRLPLQAVIRAVEQPEPLAAAPAAQATIQCEEIVLDGLKVLVVDDEVESLELVKRVLEERHAQVFTAASAAEGMALLQQMRPDVIVSDIGMPGEDGYQLMRRVRSLDATQGGATPALTLTAFAGPEHQQRAILAGYQAHLSKPVEVPQLIATLAGLAGRVAYVSNKPEPTSAPDA